MDETAVTTLFVNEFCNQINRMYRNNRHFVSEFYLWSDKRPGSVTERLEADAQDEANYQRLFRP
jgi:hypothetical protein